ncbi:hypothetical protein BAL199_18083 [alpha proteobacterium BAL199]|jgi:hypothetical protein|nr:hypothetical protein BAL199_18083 [alpha proteobacterium BAL199]
MLSDALFRLVNVAGGLGLDDSLWRRQVLGPAPSNARASARRRIAEAASRWGEETLSRIEDLPCTAARQRAISGL